MTPQAHSNGLFHFVLGKLQDAIVIVDRGGEVEFANPAAQRLFGPGVNARPGPERAFRCGILFPGESKTRTTELVDRLPLSRAIAGETVSGEELFIRNDLHPAGMRINASAFPRFDDNGHVEGAIAVYREATSHEQRRDRADSSEESLQRLQAVFDHALDAVLLANDEMRYIEANPSACHLLGYERDDLLALHVRDIVPPEHRDDAGRQWAEFLNSGSSEGEMVLVRRDGDTVQVEYRAVAHILPSLHLSVLRDVTARKLAEASLREAQRTESLGILAGSAAHDFNNLLVGIIGNASLALEKRWPDPETGTMLRDILAAGERAALLCRQMLSYAGKATVFWETLSLKDLVAEIGPLIQSAIPKQIRLVYDLQNVPAVKAAPVEVQQVVMNLIINAGQAIFEQSPGEIRVRTGVRMFPDAEAPEADTLSPGAYVTLEVEDTGRGMDKNTVERIFEPFFTTKVKGKGLGLATVRGIVRNHGGVIWVRSTPGRGSCFTVAFPAASSELTEGGREEATEQPTKRGRVLVVDNEPLVQRLAKNALEAVGHTVVVLGDGRDADSLISAPAGDFDVIILDLGIPGISATNLIRRVGDHHPNTRVIVFSGQPEQEVRRILGGVQITDFLPKPCTPAQLRDTVRKTLSVGRVDPSI